MVSESVTSKPEQIGLKSLRCFNIFAKVVANYKNDGIKVIFLYTSVCMIAFSKTQTQKPCSIRMLMQITTYDQLTAKDVSNNHFLK